ncbi:MAG: 4Fe-4S single cluster domain-containing protein [Promethearchaeota archaeon]
MNKENLLNIAKIIENSYANGPGLRSVIWFQGCNFHCKGCYNKELWPFIKKNQYTPKQLVEVILKNKKIEGITLSGGEPLLQYPALLDFLKLIKKTRLTVVCFTGFYFNQIKNSKMKDILNYIDIIIAGSYIEDLKTNFNSLISSSNQELIFLSDKYSYKDIKDEQLIEIFIDDKEIQITGFPSKKFLKEVLF